MARPVQIIEVLAEGETHAEGRTRAEARVQAVLTRGGRRGERGRFVHDVQEVPPEVLESNSNIRALVITRWEPATGPIVKPTSEK